MKGFDRIVCVNAVRETSGRNDDNEAVIQNRSLGGGRGGVMLYNHYCLLCANSADRYLLLVYSDGMNVL